MNQTQHTELLRAQREELRYRALYYQALHELRKLNVGVGRLSRRVNLLKRSNEVLRQILKTTGMNGNGEMVEIDTHYHQYARPQHAYPQDRPLEGKRLHP